MREQRMKKRLRDQNDGIRVRKTAPFFSFFRAKTSSARGSFCAVFLPARRPVRAILGARTGRAARRSVRLAFSLSIVLLLLFSFSCAVFAEGEGAFSEAFAGGEETAGSEATLAALERRLEELLPDGAPSGVGDGGAERLTDAVGVHRLLSDLLAALEGRKTSIFSFALFLFGTAILLAAAEIFSADRRLSPAVFAGVFGALCLPLFSRLIAAMRSLIGSIGEATAFLSEMNPLFSAIGAAGGGVFSAAVQSAGVALSLSVIGGLSSSFLLPAVSFLLALSPIAAVDLSGRVSSLSERVRKIFVFFLSIGSLVLVATLSLQTVIASAKDGAAIRAAKYAAGLLPMVGGALSSSLSVLSGGLSYLRSSAGVSAVAVLLSILGAPLAELILYRLSLFFGSTFLDFLGAKGAERAFSCFSAALDALIALFAFVAAVMILDVVIFLKSGAVAV